MDKLTPQSRVFLEDLRADDRFVQLLLELTVPEIPTFHPKKGETQGSWEYYSGRKDGASAILSVLKGTTNR